MSRNISKTRTIIQLDNLVQKMEKMKRIELAETLKQVKAKFEAE
jgi:hypothetical protein